MAQEENRQPVGSESAAKGLDALKKDIDGELDQYIEAGYDMEAVIKAGEKAKQKAEELMANGREVSMGPLRWVIRTALAPFKPQDIPKESFDAPNLESPRASATEETTSVSAVEPAGPTEIKKEELPAGALTLGELPANVQQFGRPGEIFRPDTKEAYSIGQEIPGTNLRFMGVDEKGNPKLRALSEWRGDEDGPVEKFRSKLEVYDDDEDAPDMEVLREILREEAEQKERKKQELLTAALKKMEEAAAQAKAEAEVEEAKKAKGSDEPKAAFVKDSGEPKNEKKGLGDLAAAVIDGDLVVGEFKGGLSDEERKAVILKEAEANARAREARFDDLAEEEFDKFKVAPHTPVRVEPTPMIESVSQNQEPTPPNSPQGEPKTEGETKAFVDALREIDVWSRKSREAKKALDDEGELSEKQKAHMEELSEEARKNVRENVTSAMESIEALPEALLGAIRTGNEDALKAYGVNRFSARIIARELDRREERERAALRKRQEEEAKKPLLERLEEAKANNILTSAKVKDILKNIGKDAEKERAWLKQYLAEQERSDEDADREERNFDREALRRLEEETGMFPRYRATVERERKSASAGGSGEPKATSAGGSGEPKAASGKDSGESKTGGKQTLLVRLEEEKAQGKILSEDELRGLLKFKNSKVQTWAQKELDARVGEPATASAEPRRAEDIERDNERREDGLAIERFEDDTGTFPAEKRRVENARREAARGVEVKKYATPLIKRLEEAREADPEHFEIPAQTLKVMREGKNPDDKAYAEEYARGKEKAKEHVSPTPSQGISEKNRREYIIGFIQAGRGSEVPESVLRQYERIPEVATYLNEHPLPPSDAVPPTVSSDTTKEGEEYWEQMKALYGDELEGKPSKIEPAKVAPTVPRGNASWTGTDEAISEGAAMAGWDEHTVPEVELNELGKQWEAFIEGKYDEKPAEATAPTVPTAPEAPKPPESPQKEIDRSVLKGFQEKFGITEGELQNIPGFSDGMLSVGRQLMVLHNLEQLTLGDTKKEARDRTKEEWKNMGWIKRVWKSLISAGAQSEKRVVEIEKELLSKQRGGSETDPERARILSRNLNYIEELVKVAKNSAEVKANPDGSLETVYLDTKMLFNTIDNELLTAKNLAIMEAFNTAASAFAKFPREWSHETSKPGFFERLLNKDRREHASAKRAYAKAREGLLSLIEARAQGKEKPEQLAMIIVNKLDEQVELNQLFNGHPDAEAALKEIEEKSTAWLAAREFLKSKGGFVAAGALARYGTLALSGGLALPVLGVAGTAMLGIGAAGAIGAGVGVELGASASKRIMNERRADGRMSEEDEREEIEYDVYKTEVIKTELNPEGIQVRVLDEKTGEPVVLEKGKRKIKEFTDAAFFAGRIDRLLEKFYDTKDADEQKAIQKRIAQTIALMREKFDRGMINYGGSSLESDDARKGNIIANRLSFIQSLAHGQMALAIDRNAYEEEIKQMTGLRQGRIEAARADEAARVLARSGITRGAAAIVGSTFVEGVRWLFDWWPGASPKGGAEVAKPPVASAASEVPRTPELPQDGRVIPEPEQTPAPSAETPSVGRRVEYSPYGPDGVTPIGMDVGVAIEEAEKELGRELSGIEEFMVQMIRREELVSKDTQFLEELARAKADFFSEMKSGPGLMIDDARDIFDKYPRVKKETQFDFFEPHPHAPPRR